jgi:hypothetical protein
MKAKLKRAPGANRAVRNSDPAASGISFDYNRYLRQRPVEGDEASPNLPVIVGLRKSTLMRRHRHQVLWTIKIRGYPEISLTTSQLHSNLQFCRICLSTLGVHFPPISVRDWCQLLDGLLCAFVRTANE